MTYKQFCKIREIILGTKIFFTKTVSGCIMGRALLVQRLQKKANLCSSLDSLMSAKDNRPYEIRTITPPHIKIKDKHRLSCIHFTRDLLKCVFTISHVHLFVLGFVIN